MAQQAYSLRLRLPGAELQTSLRLHKSQQISESALSQAPDGSWLLSTSPTTGSCLLQLSVQGDSLVLSLQESQPFDQPLYQLWAQQTPVNIFSQRAGNQLVWQGKDDIHTIAPGARGSFVFAVKNLDPYPAEYALRLRRDAHNLFDPPLSYRLRHDVSGDDYVSGDDQWYPPEDVLLRLRRAEPGQIDYYTLQWRWQSGDDALDTAIGMREGELWYRLFIEVIKTIPQLDSLHG